MSKSNHEKKLQEVIEKLRQVMVPLWHFSRAGFLKLVTKEYGINPSQFHTLHRIKSGKTSVSGLADCMHVSKPNISRAVDELVQNGYVTREQVVGDRRKVRLGLTKKADKLFTDTHDQHNQIFIKQFKGLADDELEQLSKAVDILKKVIEQQNKDEHK